MSFGFSIPSASGVPLAVDLAPGQILFVVGANGTGKSSLMHRLAAESRGKSKRISASRQTWFQSSALEFSPSQKLQFDQQAQNWDANQQSRWMEQNAQIRSGLTRYELIDAENNDARAIANAVRSGDIAGATRIAEGASPLATINGLFQLSNIPISISIQDGDRIFASKNGSEGYDAAELSDGERSALLIAADILTAKPGTLLIIDEPERHLHRAIISPLLSSLFAFRHDCAFVVATHDLLLPIDNPEARVLLVRSCAYANKSPMSWELDLVPASADIDDALKFDIIGSRRRIIFVEGDDSSLDRPLYSLLFPAASIRAKGPSREVENATVGLRASTPLHWVEVWGLVDLDGRPEEEIKLLKEKGIFALPFHSVEALYYHPTIISGVAKRYAEAVGGKAEQLANNALSAALNAVKPHVRRLAVRAVEREVRREMFMQLPKLQDIESKGEVHLSINVEKILSEEEGRLSAALNDSDWLTILRRCPIRESGARNCIAKEIGFPNYRKFEAAVLQLLREDAASRNQARQLFGDLISAIE